MAYITKADFDQIFPGNDIAESDFEMMAEVASNIIQSVCCCEPKAKYLLMPKFIQAVAWQVNFLIDQGGISAVLGQSSAAYEGSTEHLGDYSVSGGTSNESGKTAMLNGIPVCGYSLTLLEQLGLMCRLVRRHHRLHHNGKS